MKEQERAKPAITVKGSIVDYKSLILLCLKLGVSAFGGPVAHIALLEREVVQKRKWLGHERFMEYLGVTNRVPGPNSTEVVRNGGFERKRHLGTVAAGAAFILPAFLITLSLTWAYVQYGKLPEGEALFYGIQPVVIALIAGALWRLTPRSVTGLRTGAIFALALAAAFFGVSEPLTILVSGAVGLVAFNPRFGAKAAAGIALPIPWMLAGREPMQLWAAEHVMPTLSRIAWVFLKAGAVLFGSGYVLIAYIRDDLVTRLGWMSNQQLVDAIAIGQLTPGPVLTASTAVGYILSGAPGALVATTAIFLPSFIIVMLLGHWMPTLRKSETARRFLKGVNAGVVAVMLAVTLELGRAVIADYLGLVLFLGALLVLQRTKVDTLWVIGGGALVGLIRLAVVGA